MTIMISGSVRDAVKPITIVALKGFRTVWLRVRGSHDVQSFHFAAAHPQDGYPVATDSRWSSIKIFSNDYLTEESIPDGYGMQASERGGQRHEIAHWACATGPGADVRERPLGVDSGN
jgi:hypothetical protein